MNVDREEKGFSPTLLSSISVKLPSPESSGEPALPLSALPEQHITYYHLTPALVQPSPEASASPWYLSILRDDNDYTRVITLNPSADPIFIGRASKTTSKGLVAAPENAWFDSPIMSRQHGKIFMTSAGAVSHLQIHTFALTNLFAQVQLQDLASTHGTWVRSKRLAANETYDLHDGDRITFGSTVTSGPVTYHARSFVVEFPTSCGQQASPSSSSTKGSDRSGFRVPDNQYESLSDVSEADDCKILGSHPRTFSVPSSDDEVVESDDEPHHGAAVSTTRSIASSRCKEIGHTSKACTQEEQEIEKPSVKCLICDEDGHRACDCTQVRVDRFASKDAPKSYNSSHVGLSWKHDSGQNPRPTTNSQARPTMNQTESEQSLQYIPWIDDDTEDEEPMHRGQQQQDTLCQRANIDGVNSRSSSPDIEIPDTYASLLDLPTKQSVTPRFANTGRSEYEPRFSRPLSEIDVSGKKTNQDEDTRHLSSNEILGLPSSSHESEVLTNRKSNVETQQPGEMFSQNRTTVSSHRQARITDYEYESSSEPEQDGNLAKPLVGQADVRLGHGNSPISGSRSLEVSSDSSEDEYDDDCSIFSQASSRRDAVPTMPSEPAEDRASSPTKAPSPPINDAVVPRCYPHSDTLALPRVEPQKPSHPHKASPDNTLPSLPKYSREDRSLHPSQSVLKIVRAPSPSDAALVRKASSRQTSCLAPRYPYSGFEAPGYDLFARPLDDTAPYSAPGESYSAYFQDSYGYSHLGHMTGLYNSGRNHYQQGPFSRSYGLSDLDTYGSTAGRWSPSPPPQNSPKSCLVKLKVDSKTVNEECPSRRPNTDGLKSKKVDISNLVNPHADGARGLKRKSDQMSSEESLDGRALATTENSSAHTVGEDDLGPHAQARDTIIAGNETMSQGSGSDIPPSPIHVAGDAAEQGPARKKVKVSTPKAGTVGKVVSGVCLGLAGAFAAFIAATPAEVWDEALREAIKLT
ncbi:MAG: hypothetical protein Q9221_002780 [Calogaya cf. arnoldii]